MRKSAALLIAATLAGPAAATAGLPGYLNIAQYPLFLSGNVSPNVLVILDNSESMDGTMGGMLIAGNDPTTRGNIARSVVRTTITNYRSLFNWGVAAFHTTGDSMNTPNGTLYSTYAYYFGDSSTPPSPTAMVFTNDCVGGISASNADARCIANPQPGNGWAYITYALAGDDPSINDVLYTSPGYASFWGIGVNNSTSYNVYFNRTGTSATSWVASDFSAGQGSPWSFTPTDAGFLPSTPPWPRQFWTPRAWGYLNNPDGTARIWEPVQADSTTHYNRMMTLLGSETSTANSGEIKNASVFTPLAGSLQTAYQYFTGTNGQTSPIAQSCQKNFVLLATDGNPTAKLNGSMYSYSQINNTYNASTGTWTFNTAENDMFTQVSGLRAITYNGFNYDVQTYVVGLGSTVQNPGSVVSLNQLANLGGTGSAYLANDTNSLATAFQLIAIDIVSKIASDSSVALNTGSWSSGIDLYQARFSSADWSGQLYKFPILTGGALGSVTWDAGQVLNSQDWSTSRQIITYKPSAALGSEGIPFRWPVNSSSPAATELDPSQITALNTSPSNVVDGYGSLRLAYLRGDHSHESYVCPTCTPVFRNRTTSVLGDLVDSAPYYVGVPNYGYPDTLESAPYSTFAQNLASRAPMIYVGANDGMLHGFSAVDGHELFAYVPSPVYANLSNLPSTSYWHHFYVDGTPTIGDAFYGGAWHTVLVGGLRGGGQGIYALDVTNPGNFSEANAANMVLWEFNDGNDPDLGNVYGQPLIVKTANGRWSAIIPNGYDNTAPDGSVSATGDAVLYVIDIQTGTVTAKIPTLSGTTTAPNGLSPVVAIDTNGDVMADTVYAGDLLGNLWKFDISSSDPTKWKVAFGTSTAPLPLFADPNGQPITVRPDVTPLTTGGYMVLFGTGRYIDVNDPTTTASQTFYGIKDLGVRVTALSSLQQQSVLGTALGSTGTTYRITTHAVGPPTLDTTQTGDNAISAAAYASTKMGWYMVLPTSGERITADPAVRSNRIVFVTLIPNPAPCAYGGNGWVMDLDVTTGNRLSQVTFDTNNTGSLTSADLLPFNGSNMNTSGQLIGSIPSAPGFLRLPTTPGTAATERKFINTSSGAIASPLETAGTKSNRRLSWEQLR